MKIFKLEFVIIDEDLQDIAGTYHVINETRYPNHANVKAISRKEADIVEWDDNHPLNNSDTFRDELSRLFPSDLNK